MRGVLFDVPGDRVLRAAHPVRSLLVWAGIGSFTL
jgi:hypothetical protein